MDAEERAAHAPAAPHQNILCRGAAQPAGQPACLAFLLLIRAHAAAAPACTLHLLLSLPRHLPLRARPPQVWLRQHETKEETVLFQELPHALRNEVAWQACKQVFR